MTTQEIGQALLINPLFYSLKFLYTTTGNFGVAIIMLTLAIRALLIPLTLPTIKSQKKMQQLKPQLDKLKKLHRKDSKKLQQAQLALFKEHNVNPLSGCLPYIIQLIVIIALYNVLSGFVARAQGEGLRINTMFLGWDLSAIDPTYIIPILAAVTQLILSLMLLPGIEKHDVVSDTSTSKSVKKANEKETNQQEMAETMQRQMVFLMPIMTGFFALRFPAGLGLYWIVTTVFSIVQQWIVSGPGGLETVLHRVKARIR